MDAFQVILLGFLILLVGVFFLRSIFQRFMVFFAHITLICGILGVVLGLFTNRPFEFMANRALQNNGTIETIQKIDSYLQIETAVIPVTNLVEQLKSWWNKAPKTETKVPEQEEVSKNKLLESNLLPGIVSSVAGIYRSVTVILSFGLLVFAVYLNYLNASATEITELKRKYSELATKLNRYEQEKQ